MHKQVQKLYGFFSIEQALLTKRRKCHRLILKKSHHISQRLHHLATLAKSQNLPILWDSGQLLKLEKTQPNAILECEALPLLPSSFISKKTEKTLFLALDQLEDPQNIGAIIRTCGFLNVTGLITCHAHFTGLSPTVSKVSCGVAESYPVIGVPNLARTLQNCKKQGFWIIGLDLNAPMNLSEIPSDLSIILVVGNEGKGLRPLVKKQCDLLVQIQGNPNVSSLNVSATVAIATYHFMQNC